MQLRDDAMTRRAFRRSKAQIQIFQRRSRRVSFSSQRANATTGGCKYRRRYDGECGEEEGREGGGEKRVAARRRRHRHRRARVFDEFSNSKKKWSRIRLNFREHRKEK